MRARAFAVAAVAAVALSSCGKDAAPQVALARVDPALAPASVGDGLALYESTAEETVKAFANPGEHTLISDGKLWEIRRADRLIGALQVTTVLPDVDLAEADTRDTIVNQIIPGTGNRIRIGDEEVFTLTVNDKAVFVWFGRDVYVVLQLKDRELDGKYDAIAEDVIDHQATTGAWHPLPLEIDDSSD